MNRDYFVYNYGPLKNDDIELIYWKSSRCTVAQLLFPFTLSPVTTTRDHSAKIAKVRCHLVALGMVPFQNNR